MFIRNDFEKLKNKVWLSSPTMHGEELEYMQEAYDTNWMSTLGRNIDEVEHLSAKNTDTKFSVALSSGTAALHLALRVAGVEIYGYPQAGHGCLEGKKVFCSDMTFAATVNPVTYEGGIPIFIDEERESWNMDPVALRKAFELFPEVKIVVVANLYGTPGKLEEIREIVNEYNGVLIEDAAESLGASYNEKKTGSFGDYSVISFNGNKIITGSSGGCFLSNDERIIERIRKWSTQSRESAAWYQHEEIGYNYRMSNVIAGVVRGQFPHLFEHIEQKKQIYERYKDAFKDFPVSMNPIPSNCEPNYWLSCLMINKEVMSEQIRSERTVIYKKESGKTCPSEILDALTMINAEGRPIWKPMHLQPIYKSNIFVTCEGVATEKCVGSDIFERGLCLPSDNKMTVSQQNHIIDVIKACFD